MAVRLEKVIVDLEDRFTGPAARIAAATHLINKELGDLSGQAVRSRRDLDPVGDSITKVGRQADSGSKQIDKLSGRLSILLDLAAILGPGLVPIGAVGIPAISGLAATLGFAAIAGGGFIIAVQGIGGALEAMNKAQLEPTAENLEAARAAMQNLAPAGQQLVTELRGLADEWDRLKAAGQEGLFPGAIDALDSMHSRVDDFERGIFNVNQAVGDMLADGAESLASDRWDEFFDFIATDAPPAIAAMGQALGNVTHAMTGLWTAFDPLNDDFLTWVVDATARLDEWAAGLEDTRGFQEFVAYVRDVGPQVADTLGAVGMAFIRIAEAAAPLGGPVLAAIEGIADALSAIADSPAGPAIMGTVTALALLRRSMAVVEAAGRTTWATNVKGADTFAGKIAASRGVLLKGAAAVTGLAVASSGVADGMGLSNTASMALMGTIAGPWGAAIGGGVGLLLDLAGGGAKASLDLQSLTDTLNQQTGAITANTRAYAAQTLEQDGVLKAAQDLGLSLSDVTSAALNDEEALARVNAQLDATSAGFRDSNGHLIVGTEVWSKFGENSNQVLEAIGRTGGTLDEAQGKIARMGDAVGGTADDFAAAESAAESFATAMARLNRQLSARANMRDYEASLDGLTASIKENGRTLDITTEKGRANQAALDDIAATAVKVAEGLKGADRVEFMRRARADFIQARVNLRGVGVSAEDARAKAKDLANELGLVARGKWDPKVNLDDKPAKTAAESIAGAVRHTGELHAHPQITVDSGNSLSVIGSVRGGIEGIRSKTVYVNVLTRRTNESGGFGATGSADGGPVPKTGLPYADRHLYLLADGEFVVSNRHGQADRNRARLERINAGLADGGWTDPWPYAWKQDRRADYMAASRGGGVRGNPFEYIDPKDKRGDRTLAEFRRDEIRQMREIHREVAKVVRQLKIDLAEGGGTVRSTLRDFKRQLHEAGGAWTRGLERQAEKIRNASERYDRLTKSVEAQQKAVDDANAALAEIQSTQASFASAVAGRFQTDLFGGGLAGMDRALTGDIGNIGRADQALARIRGLGLDPTSDFYRQLATSNDVTTLEQLAASGAGGVSHYANQYATRSAMSAGSGATQADLSYGQAVRDATAAAQAQTAILERQHTQQRNLQDETNRRLDKLEKAAAVDGPDRTAKGVRDGVDGWFTNAWNRGRNR